MKRNLIRLLSAALAALLLAGLLPLGTVPAAAEEISLTSLILTENEPVELPMRRIGGVWYADAAALAEMASCKYTLNENSSQLSFYRPDTKVILHTVKAGEAVVRDGRPCVPFDEASRRLGLCIRSNDNHEWYVTAMKTPKDLEKVLNTIFTRKNYQLWEVPAQGGWEWATLETASRIWAMLPFVGSSSALDVLTGKEEQERYDRALTPILSDPGPIVNLVYTTADMDRSLKKAGKILASSEKGIDFAWKLIESNQGLSKKLTDAGLYETLRNMLSTGSNPYENDPGDLFRDYPAVSNAINLSYFLERSAFYGMAVDGEEAALTAMYKALGSSSNKRIKSAATRMYQHRFGDQIGSVADIYGGYFYHLVSSTITDKAMKILYGTEAFSTGVLAQGLTLSLEWIFDSPSISSISDATIYFSIYSAYAIDLSDYYFRHRSDTAPHTWADLRGVGILYLNTARACVEKCKFDDTMSQTTAAMDQLINADLLSLLEFGDQEYDPDFDNDHFLQRLDETADANPGTPSGNTPASLPADLYETSWWYSHGQSMGGQEALLFHEDGRVSSYHLGSGSFGPDYTFTYADGKLILTNEYGSSTAFLWTGEQFRSEEQYEMQVGSDYEYISKDPRQMIHFRPEEETEPAPPPETETQRETEPSLALPFDITGHWNAHDTNYGTGWYEVDLTIYSADRDRVTADWTYNQDGELHRGTGEAVWIGTEGRGTDEFVELHIRYGDAIASFVTAYFYRDGTAALEIHFLGTIPLTRTDGAPAPTPTDPQPPAALADGTYYGLLKDWTATEMTVELLEYEGRSELSYNYLLSETGELRTLPVGGASVGLEYAWSDGEEIRCASIDEALSTPVWDGSSTLGEVCPMQIRFLVRNGAVEEILFLYAA